MRNEGSYFDGNTWQLIGYRILSAFVNTITLGIAYPWMLCMVQSWEAKHTVIHGRRLKFNGHGHQLIGKYLLWVFLTLITFGIYGIWLGLGMKKWVVKHTVYADEEQPVDSYFSGGAGGYFGIHILLFIITLFTLGIGKAWADKMVLCWEAKHTHIGGSPLEFNGTGGQLFVKYLLLILLTPITLGIYALFFTVIYIKWQIKHTEAVYQTPEIQAKAKAHEMAAVQDFAKYRIAANDQEIAAMKSGYTGKEDADTLERLVEENNPFASYHLAKQLKCENTIYEGRALELLQKAADGKVHSALLDLAKQLPPEQIVSMLTEAAQCGNAEASWLLAVEYKKANDLPQAAYWFKVALEREVANAKNSAAEYDELVNNIALQLSENREMPKQSKVLPIVLGIVGTVLLVVVSFGVMAIFGLRFGVANEDAPAELVMYDWDAELEGDGTKEFPYIIATAYDFQKYVSYSGENLYGTITADFEICADYLYYGSHENNLDYFQQQVEKGYIRFQSEGIEISYNGVTVICENRINLSDLSQTYIPSDDDTVEVTSPTESTDTPSASAAPEINLADSIIGEWVCYDMLTNMTTGEDTLEVWEFAFNSDGTYGFVHNECMVSTEGGIYYGGRCWMAMLGYGQDGTYKIDGNKLSVQYYLDGENAVLTTTDYTVELHENILSIYCDGWDRTRDFERK